MKYFFTILFLSFSVALMAQPVSAKNDSARAEFLMLKTSEHDFGKIPQGKPVSTFFEVVNKGNIPLKVDNVQASCGCTTPEWEHDKTLAPGESTKIKVGYNAAAPGNFNKTITVFYNTNQTKQFVIKGEVWSAPVQSAPANETLKDIQ